MLVRTHSHLRSTNGLDELVPKGESYYRNLDDTFISSLQCKILRSSIVVVLDTTYGNGSATPAASDFDVHKAVKIHDFLVYDIGYLWLVREPPIRTQSQRGFRRYSGSSHAYSRVAHCFVSREVLNLWPSTIGQNACHHCSAAPIEKICMSKSSNNLWASALETLAHSDRQQLTLYDGQDRLAILSDLQVLTESAKGQCIKKRWRFKKPGRNGETIVLRDIFQKMVVWIDMFKQIGDTVVQYDPGHAALPWAGLRFILQVAIGDIVRFDFVVKGMESIARMIGRYAIFEDVYLRRTSKATTELENALIQLYSTILLYQSKAKSFFDQSSPKRILGSVFVTEDEFESLARRMESEQSNVDHCAAILDAENQNDISNSLEALSISQYEKHRGLMDLLRTIDGPILRMSSQLNGIEDRLDRSKRFDILRWISAQPYLEHHDQISKKALAGTGKWLLEDPLYEKWHKESTSSLLWLHGKVGAGKSTLVSIVIEDAKRRFDAGQSPPPVFFYCSRNAAEPQRSDPAAILSSIVRQLSCTEPGLPLLSPIIEIYERKGQGFNSQGLQIEESRDLITRLIEYYPMTTVIIDALDECDPEKRDLLLDTIESLLQDSSLGLLKVFLSSRDDQDISCTLRDYPNLDLVSSRNSADIEAFVKEETDRLVRKQRLLRNSRAKESLKVLIIEEVARAAHGMFRWAALQLELLCTMKLDQDVRARLGRIPPKLEQLYQEIYDKNLLKYPGEVGQSIINNIMRWLLCAQRPMKASEFCTAVVLNVIPEEELTKEHVLDLSHGFVVFDDSLDVFRFAHLSVREFLEKQDEYAAISCHLMAAETCLLQFIGSSDWSAAKVFLQHNYTLDVCDKATSTAPVLGGFHSYATMFWARHSQSIGEEGRKNNARFERIFRFFLSDASSDLSPLNVWIQSDRRSTQRGPLRWLFNPENGFRPDDRAYYLACAYGFCEIIRLCMDENPPEARDEGCFLAIENAEAEALKILLNDRSENEISMYLVGLVARNMDFDTLQWVLKKRKVEVTTWLDELIDGWGVEKDLVERLIATYKPAKVSRILLEYAAAFCSASTFESLLRLSDNSEASWDVLTEQAAQSGNWEVMRLLLEKKNLQVTPSIMQAIAKSGDSKTVRLLLDQAGAGDITSDLISASVLNHDENVLSLLLDRYGVGGVSRESVVQAIRSRYERSLTVLLNHGYSMSQSFVHEAAARGYAFTLRLLLDRGGLITGSVLRCAANNYKDGANVIGLLLAEAKEGMILQEMKEMMKIAARRNNPEGLAIMRQLLDWPGNNLISEDVLATAAIGYSGGEMIKLFSGRIWEMTEEVLEVMMKCLASEEALQLVLDQAEDFENTGKILLAVASNPSFADQLMGRLWDKVNMLDIIDPLLVEAAGNQRFGLEVILLLQRRLGDVKVTQKTLERASIEGSMRTMTFLLDYASAPITEVIIVGALMNNRLQMVRLLLNRATELPVTQNMVHVAAKYCSLECLVFVWERAHIVDMNEEDTRNLVQSAIENRWWAKDNLSFFLDEIENIVVGPEILIKIARKAHLPALLFNFLIEHGVNFHCTGEVLQAAAGSTICYEGPLMNFLLEQGNKVELTDEIFKAAAGSGSRTILEVLSNYCGMAEIPQRWLDLACLHDAVHSGSSESSYSHFPPPGGDDLNLGTVIELLGRGVEPDVPDENGLTPLFHAAVLGNILTVQALLSAGANPNATGRYGATPLFFAAWGGHYATVELLLDLGVSTHLEVEQGQTPASIAKSHGHIKVFKLLERRRQP